MSMQKKQEDILKRGRGKLTSEVNIEKKNEISTHSHLK